jgi:hypothetical protein
MKRVLVCGGREFSNWDLLRDTLTPLAGNEPYCKIFIIAGGARGADALAIRWARLHACEFKEYPANWKAHGKLAGPVRNQRMLDDGKPDLVIAFPGGSGTADMVRRAKNDGIEVREIRYGQADNLHRF